MKKTNAKMPKWVLTLNEDQAYIIKNIVEAFARMTSGQVVEAIRLIDYYKPSGGITMPDQYEHIERELRRVFFPELSPNESYGAYSNKLKKESRIAWDLYQVIRQPLALKRVGGKARMLNVECDDPMQSCQDCALASFKELKEGESLPTPK